MNDHGRQWGIEIEPPGEIPDEPEKPGVIVGPMSREDALAWAVEGDWAGDRAEALRMLVQIVPPDRLVSVDTEDISPETMIDIARDRYDEQQPEEEAL